MERKFLIRDVRNGDWLWVYRSLIGDPHLTDADKLIYQSLASFAGMKQIVPSYRVMGLRVNSSKRTAIKSVKRLIEVGYIAMVKKGSKQYDTNEYLLLKMPKGCKLCTSGRGEGKDTSRGEANSTSEVKQTTPYKDSNKDIYKDTDNYLNILKERGKLRIK